jgi:hypothetical protein
VGGSATARHEDEANESGTLIRTDFEQLAPGNFRSPRWAARPRWGLSADN